VSVSVATANRFLYQIGMDIYNLELEMKARFSLRVEIQ